MGCPYCYYPLNNSWQTHCMGCGRRIKLSKKVKKEQLIKRQPYLIRSMKGNY